MTGVRAIEQPDVAGAAWVSVGVHGLGGTFVGFTEISPTGTLQLQSPGQNKACLWMVAYISNRLQLTSVLSPELSRGPFPPHYLCWVHQPSKGTFGAEPLLRWPQAKSPSCGQQQVHQRMHAPFCWQMYDSFPKQPSSSLPSQVDSLGLMPLKLQESVIPRTLASDSRRRWG